MEIGARTWSWAAPGNVTSRLEKKKSGYRWTPRCQNMKEGQGVRLVKENVPDRSWWHVLVRGSRTESWWNSWSGTLGPGVSWIGI
jgi:hypothetical protein